ncbi:phosphotriesterase [Telluribacter sp.]|jgi:phosphotriesterase-related protein|uniref:phosphotriesterase family protein n=1 Tax=Telluribacter sp. TaxID=1978767 RepID=UPI002E110917|nr:phosphotriesterase [Telluribacter sp.]
MFSRRHFLRTLAVAPLGLASYRQAKATIWSVNGQVPAQDLGTTLIHEHILVDFIGADQISPERWKREEVTKKVLPYLMEAKARGVKSILDCTPAFLGRDVQLLKDLSQRSGLHILTNTGYYGAVDNKYLPPWAFTETAEQLAKRWIAEFKNGIEGTLVRPGFIKIGVNAGTLSALHRKLITAAALAHLQTGLTICSHTGPALPAFEEIEVLKKLGVHPSAFVWVHAQNEKDKTTYLQAARAGTWVSLDGIGWGNFNNYADWIALMKDNNQLHRVLISHDAGWYRPGEPNGGDFVGYTNIFTELLPLLKNKGFSSDDFQLLLVRNPAEAFGIRVRKS